MTSTQEPQKEIIGDDASSYITIDDDGEEYISSVLEVEDIFKMNLEQDNELNLLHLVEKLNDLTLNDQQLRRSIHESLRSIQIAGKEDVELIIDVMSGLVRDNDAPDTKNDYKVEELVPVADMGTSFRIPRPISVKQRENRRRNIIRRKRRNNRRIKMCPKCRYSCKCPKKFRNHMINVHKYAGPQKVSITTDDLVKVYECPNCRELINVKYYRYVRCNRCFYGGDRFTLLGTLYKPCPRFFHAMTSGRNFFLN